MKTTSLNLKNCLLLLAPLVLATASVKAATLADLLAGGSISSGNLVFFNFHSPSQNSSVPSLDTAGFDHISVIPIEPLATQFGIRFQSSLWSLGPNQNYDLGLEFSVRTLTGTAIIGNTLSLSGDVGAVGQGNVDIVEAVHNLAGNSLATEMVWIDGNDSSFSSRLLDLKNFAPTPVLEISKDLAMATGDAAGSAVSVQYFDQTFSQPTITVVTTAPEGGPGLLGSFSVLGVLCWAGRKQFRKAVR